MDILQTGDKATCWVPKTLFPRPDLSFSVWQGGEVERRGVEGVRPGMAFPGERSATSGPNPMRRCFAPLRAVWWGMCRRWKDCAGRNGAGETGEREVVVNHEIIMPKAEGEVFAGF